MLIASTLLFLSAWMAFIWIVDPDGFRRAAAAAHKDTPNSFESSNRRAGAVAAGET